MSIPSWLAQTRPFQCKSYYLRISGEQDKSGEPDEGVDFQVTRVDGKKAWFNFSPGGTEAQYALMKNILNLSSYVWWRKDFWVTVDPDNQITAISKEKPTEEIHRVLSDAADLLNKAE